MRRVVVVGASLAGLRTAEALRAHGFQGELTLVGAEPHEPYDRPPLSKGLLAGALAPADCMLRRRDGMDARWLLGRCAVRLDVAARVVALDDGAELPFDGLAIATGAAARGWPTAAAEGIAGIHVLRGLDDALALRAAARDARCAAIVGAGFVGCEVAATLRGAGLAVTLIDVLERPMAPLGETLGEVCAALHAEHGVALRMGRRVAGFEAGADGRVRAVALDDGEEVPADLVVLALGPVANVDWLAGSGLDVADGVVTDAHCLAAEGVVAVGDVAVFPHPLAGERPVSIRHWSNAVEQAAVAAANLLAPAGERRRYLPVPSFWSDQYDARIQALGFPARGERLTFVEGAPGERRFVALAERGGQLVGAVALNTARGLLPHRRRLAAELVATVP